MRWLEWITSWFKRKEPITTETKSVESEGSFRFGPNEKVLTPTDAVSGIRALPQIDAAATRHYDASYIHLRRDLAAKVWDVFERLDKLNWRRAEYVEDFRVIDHLWGCDFLMLDFEMGKRMKGSDRWSVVDGVETAEMADVLWPIDYAFAYAHKDGLLELVRITSVTAKEMRGRLSRVAKKMLHVVVLKINAEGGWQTVEGVVGLINGKWVYLEQGKWLNVHKYVSYHLPSILTARYEWHIALGIKDGPRLLFPTNPSGCLKLFNNRDKPTTGGRRNALKHWVEEHWREGEGKEDLEYVCNHLRGGTVFDWSGLSCELFVSAYDLEKNEFFKRQAREWRAQRKHNVVRVKMKEWRRDRHIH